MKRILASALIVSSLLVGCAGGTPPQLDGGTQYLENYTPSARVTGFSWDPEAYLGILLPCGPDCPPEIGPNNPLYVNTSLAGSQVTMLDPVAGGPVGAPVPSGPDSTWVVTDVPIRPAPPYLPFSLGGGSFAVATDPADPGYPGPAATYLPTATLQPVFANYGTCILAEAASISTTGIAQALAKYLTASGTATTVDDLVDPSKFGGVAVFWMLPPGDPIFRAPSDATTMTASLGTIYNIDWAPPGAGDPTYQSARGFYIDPALNPTSGIGITVLVLPPDQAGAMVTITGVDPSEDGSQYRPWLLPSMDVPIIPGAITYGSFGTRPTPPPGYVPPDDGVPELAPGAWFCGP